MTPEEKDNQASQEFSQELRQAYVDGAKLVGHFIAAYRKDSESEETKALQKQIEQEGGTVIPVSGADPEVHMPIIAMFEQRGAMMTPEQEQSLDLYSTAQELYRKNQYSECLAILDQALVFSPNESEFWRWRGDALRALKDYKAAWQAFDKALECDPLNWRAECARAYTHLEQGELEKALELYETVLAKQKHFFCEDRCEILYYRALILQKQGRLEAAFAGYSDAYTYAALKEEKTLLLNNRGNVNARLGHFADAVADYDRATAVDPDNANSAWMALWGHMSEEGAALHFYDNQRRLQLYTIRDLEPASYIASMCRGLLALGGGHFFDVALTHFEAASAQKPDEWDPPFWCGLTLALLGKNEQAQQAIDKALTMGLPPMLLVPLYWTQEGNPAFFADYATPLLQRFGL